MLQPSRSVKSNAVNVTGTSRRLFLAKMYKTPMTQYQIAAFLGFCCKLNDHKYRIHQKAQLDSEKVEVVRLLYYAKRRI